MKTSPIVIGAGALAITTSQIKYPDRRDDGTPLQPGDINIDNRVSRNEDDADWNIWLYKPTRPSKPNSGNNWVEIAWPRLNFVAQDAIRAKVGTDECRRRGWA